MVDAPKMKNELVLEIDEFIEVLREIARALGARRPQDIGLTDYSERWIDMLGNEHVFNIIWATYPKRPFMNKPLELQERGGEIIIIHKIISGVPGVFTDHQVLRKIIIGVETEELGKKIKILYVR